MRKTKRDNVVREQNYAPDKPYIPSGIIIESPTINGIDDFVEIMKNPVQKQRPYESGLSLV